MLVTKCMPILIYLKSGTNVFRQENFRFVAHKCDECLVYPKKLHLLLFGQGSSY